MPRNTCDTSVDPPVCVTDPDPCPGQVCNPDTQMCEDECAVDADCDDGFRIKVVVQTDNRFFEARPVTSKSTNKP